MRTITTHHTNDANRQIVLEADERDPNNGNASHQYELRRSEGQLHFCTLQFQNGPIGEVGVNGITNEVLLAVVIDRLAGFQSSKWACEENARALSNVREALADLESRTKARQERGVEGTHEV